jgi:hypothetical protein
LRQVWFQIRSLAAPYIYDSLFCDSIFSSLEMIINLPSGMVRRLYCHSGCRLRRLCQALGSLQAPGIVSKSISWKGAEQGSFMSETQKWACTIHTHIPFTRSHQWLHLTHACNVEISCVLREKNTWILLKIKQSLVPG